MLPVRFHPLVERWFSETFSAPTEVQARGWEAIATGSDTLLAAPTGSGKTLAAFLWAIDRLVEASVAGLLEDRTYVVYVSPLKALGNDIEKNLRVPLAGIRELALSTPYAAPDIRVSVRTGDTPSTDRQKQARRPPHILITTPESLYILLTAERSREALRLATTVIVDEIHAVAGDKRGAHLALSLERLDDLCGRPLQRIGLSATQKPIEEVARLLVGNARCEPGGKPRCTIVDVGHRRDIELRVEVPELELGPIATHEVRAEVYERLVELVESHRTTIVFVDTRRMVERVAHALGEKLGKERVAAHHGSLSRETRLAAEEGLKSGRIPVVVATASLELGIDVGFVDLVCHLGAPRSLASLLQRVGRSGHFLGAVPKGILFPLTRDELLQCAAAVRAVRAGELDRVEIPESPLDILAQQIVAHVASRESTVEELWELVRRAYPYRGLARKDFDDVIEMLSEGVSTRRGRRSAHLHYDRVHGRLRARRGARLAAITSGGAIPDTADYAVVEEPGETFVGTVNEDFAVESLAGDIFLLGNRSWRIRRVEAGRIRVEDAQGLPPTIPFWLGEAPARTAELSEAVSDLRREVARRLDDPAGAAAWLASEAKVDPWGAEQIVRYVADTVAVLGTVPTTDTVVAERFFDEAGGMQLVLHAPFGGRVNRALGFALRKRFCVTFDFELQAAATDDGVVLSLGEQHSFPLESVFGMLRPERLEEDLVQAVLVSPMFTNRWRWNATRALALLRQQGGKRVPMPIQRMRAEDLLAAVFPAQVACADNHTGPIEPPDHPLVKETLANCLHEAMDLDGLRRLVEDMRAGRVRTVAVETPAPSPMSHEILNANPYAFLDDAPLEERRARAVSLRRVDPELATGAGALDPEAIEEVRRQAWPDVRDADELHDSLLALGVLPVEDAEPWGEEARRLVRDGRATTLVAPGGSRFYVAAERLEAIRELYPGARAEPPLSYRPPGPLPEAEETRASVVQGWLEVLGPVTAEELARRLDWKESAVEAALARLESLGVVLRGHFTPLGRERVEWCERRLLARIHRLTLGKLRKEIEAVSAADFLRFLFRWQHVHTTSRLHGREGVRAVVAQLQGLELPGPAWERDVFPARVARYDPADLEHLCLSGEVAWGRLSVAPGPVEEAAVRRIRRRQAPTRSAPLAFFLREDAEFLLTAGQDDAGCLAGLSSLGREVFAFLSEKGASFLSDIARGLRRLPTEVEGALWELVASGLVTGDGVAGLRTLLLPDEKRAPRRRERRHLRGLPGGASRRLMPVGRWALLRTGVGPPREREEVVERWGRQLLRRYGVVFRELLARERHAPSWRELHALYRRMEARGELRGGRFVGGFLGEQFALPEAVEALREVRRKREAEELVVVSAADPLNLVGILTPGGRVSPYSAQVVAYAAGVPVEIGELGSVLSRLQSRA
ncbi:MAG: ATP-dependent DNA helicase [Candidatus Binatia bacterium]|nr:MAG: ATP-dependent DNA helicase [Candidatus Binatia bacterium]